MTTTTYVPLLLDAVATPTDSPAADPTGDAAIPDELTVAVDTEFHHQTTLTVQAAARLPDGRVAVQVYRDTRIPDLPDPDRLAADLLAGLGPAAGRCPGLVLRPTRPLAADLSPAVLIRDLLGLAGAVLLSRAAYAARLAGTAGTSPPPFDGVEWDARKGRWRTPEVRVTVVNHFQRADFARTFGAAFAAELFRPPGGAGRLRLDAGKVLRLTDGTPGPRDPVVQYLAHAGRARAVRPGFRDTNLPFGGGSSGPWRRRWSGPGRTGG